MAFPKDGKAKDLMFGAPSDIPETSQRSEYSDFERIKELEN